jgi:outer membrane protein OmpA-like peptidoglycan-associated protein
MDSNYQTTSKFTTNQESHQTADLIVNPNIITEMAFINRSDSVLLLTSSEESKISKISNYLEDAISQLRQAKKDASTKLNSAKAVSIKEIEKSRKKVIDAADKFDKKLKEITNHFDFIPEKTSNSSQVGGIAKEKSGGVEFTEIYRFKEKQITLLPSELLKLFEKSPKGQKKRFSLLNKEDRSVQGTRRYWQEADGSFNKERFKELFAQTKADIKAEWKLIDPNKKDAEGNYKHQGQIPIDKFFGPVIGNIFKGQFQMIDEWIEQVNKNLKVQYKQFKSDREEILSLLKKDYKEFSSDDLGRIQYLVKYIWEDSELYKTEQMRIKDDFQFPLDGKSHYSELNQIVIGMTELPPANYSAEAGVEFMRYSYGLTASGTFDLKSGKIAFETKGEAKLSLVDAKAKASGYIPAECGFNINFQIAKSKTEYQLKRDDSALCFASTHFEFNKSFIRIEGLHHLNSLLQEIASNNVTNKNGLMVHIEGHTDKVGGESYNQILSEERAEATKAYLNNEPHIWARFFTHRGKRWGQKEIDYMIDTLPKPFTLPMFGLPDSDNIQIPFLPKPIKERDDFSGNLVETQSLFSFTRLDGQVRPYIGCDMNLDFINDRIGLSCLIQHYFDANRANIDKVNQLIFTSSAMPKMINGTSGKGELEPKINTEQRELKNRRVEFIPFTLQPIKVEEPTLKLNFGHTRLKIDGHVAGWAGASLTAAAKIDFDVSNGILQAKTGIKNGQSKQEATKNAAKANANAGGSAEAFAGARVEAGIKGALEWKSPNPEPKKSASDNPEPPKWGELGSVGYTVTGSAGVGITGDFNIGWDDDARKFLIKAKASACLGLGCGGSFAFTVDARHVWNFIVLVHDKLCEADFNHIDIFDTTDNVYERINAFSYELIRQGNLFSGISTMGINALGYTGIRIMDELREHVRLWQQEERKIENLHQIINNIQTNKSLVIHLTPEAKGRLLYDLTHTRSDIIDWQVPTLFQGPLAAGRDLHLGKNWLFGIDEAREEAILTILEYGIQSQRDFQETLEHMTPTSCKSNSKTQSCAVALDKANKNKATFDHNFNILRDYLNDWGDSRRLNRWHDKLPISATKVAGKKKLPIARP